MATTKPHITPERRRDPQYAAAIHIFDKLGWGHRYIVPEGIDKAGLLRALRGSSHGEQIMMKVALDLFDPGCVAAHGCEPAGWGKATAVLDPSNLKIIIEAMHIVRGALHLAQSDASSL